MVQFSREAIAYILIGLVVLIGVPSLIVVLRRRRRHRLRQRGIKRYGH